MNAKNKLVGSFAKVTRPEVKNIYLRTRLLNLIDAKRKSSIIWINGPPGSGKTTLVNSYVEQTDEPCLWYHMDAGDTDPAAFISYLGLGKRKAAPRSQKRLPYLTPEYQQGLQVFFVRYFEKLFNIIGSPSVFIFDNYHELPNESVIHLLMQSALTIVPKGVCIFFISRSAPPPEFMRFAANQSLESIDWPYLQLTVEETIGIIDLLTSKRPSQKFGLKLHREVDGWAAGLVLKLEAEGQKGMLPSDTETPEYHKIFSYFASELFNRSASDVQQFLLRTALLPKFSKTIAQELTGLPQANAILSQLCHQNYFITRVSTKPILYQYHDLFRSFLLKQVERNLTQKAIIELRERAADLLEKGGEIEAAVELVLHNGSWNHAVRLLLQHAPQMTRQGRYQQVAGWLRQLPQELMKQVPWLVFWSGVCKLLFQPLQSQGFFENAFEQFRQQEDKTGMFLAWSGVIDAIELTLADHTPLDHWLAVFDDIKSDFEDLPDSEIKAQVAKSMISAISLCQPNHPDAEYWVEVAYKLYKDAQDLTTRASILFQLFWYRFFYGCHLAEMKILINELGQLNKSAQAPPLSHLWLKQAQAMLFQMQGQFSKSLQAVSEGLEIADHSGVHFLDGMFKMIQISNALSLADLPTAEKHMPAMAMIASKVKGLPEISHRFLLARLELIKQQFQSAVFHAQTAMGDALKSGLDVTVTDCRLIYAQALFENGNHQQAMQHLDRSLAKSQTDGQVYSQFAGLLIKAYFELDRGQRATGIENLKAAFQLGQKYGIGNTIVDQPSVIARLCGIALEEKIETDYVRKFIRRHRFKPSGEFNCTEKWPWSIKIYTFNDFRVLKKDDLLKFGRKIQIMPLRLLKAIIALGGKNLPEHRLSDMLWPDADGDVAHRSFATTLHRLRKLLDNHDFIHLQNRKITIDRELCWVDCWEFERLIKDDTSNNPTARDVDQWMNKIDTAAALYKGDFLTDETWAPEIVAKRKNLRDRLLHCVYKIGEIHEKQNEFDTAIKWYQRGLHVDPLAEPFYQRLMLCNEYLGQFEKALDIFHCCRKKVSIQFGTEPSLKTTKIHNRIKNRILS